MATSSFRSTIFYSVERAIKVYRRFALGNIRRVNPDITINQALLLSLIEESPDMSQVEMAAVLFKDFAAITRMIELMVKRGFLSRIPHPEDRRRSQLRLTPLGQTTVRELSPVIKANRERALSGLSENERTELRRLLQKIIDNCNNPNDE